MQTEVTVTRKEATAFLEEATRNWKYVSLTTGDIDDVASALSAFARHRLAALADAQGEPVATEVVEALEALLNALDSCIDLTPGVIAKARTALAKHERTPHD